MQAPPGTAIVVLDATLNRLGWTWLLNAPANQIAPHARPELAALSRGGSLRFRARRGDADGFAPVHEAPVYDVRLLSYRGQLLATCIVPAGDALSVVHLQLTATPTASGGLRELRAWASSRLVSAQTWLLGRNQALFSSPSSSTELMVQPWLGVVGSLGRVAFERKRVACLTPNVTLRQWRHLEAAGAVPKASASHRLQSLRAEAPRIQHGSFIECGSHPALTLVELDGLAPERGPDGASGIFETPLKRRRRMDSRKRLLQAELVANQTLDALLGSAGLGARRLSPTAHLLTIVGTRRDGQRCRAVLGVGHLHRGDGSKNHLGCHLGQCKSRFWHKGDGHHAMQPFQFGYLYTHFFYTLHEVMRRGIEPAHLMARFFVSLTSSVPLAEQRAPHRLTATSGEFCLGSAQDAADCESTQFVSGLEHYGAASGGKLLLAFGVNDCEAKAGVVDLGRVGKMLRALPGEEREACLPG